MTQMTLRGIQHHQLKRNAGMGTVRKSSLTWSSCRKYLCWIVVVVLLLNLLLGIFLFVMETPPAPAPSRGMTEPLRQRGRRERRFGQPSSAWNFWKRRNDDESPGFDERDPNRHNRESILQDLRQGQIHLVDVDLRRAKYSSDGSYRGVIGYFCQLDWSQHKENPSELPMFRHLIAASPDCSRGLGLGGGRGGRGRGSRSSRRNLRKLDLAEIMTEIRAADASPDSRVHAMQVSGLIFHESRCGSTLLANMLAAASPHYRVYTESSPPLLVVTSEFHARRDGTAGVIQLLQDVVYLMSRSNGPEETRVFFKIQSIGTKSIPLFSRALPEVPWIYLYRHPVQVIMSHLPSPRSKRAVCLRTARDPPDDVHELARKLAPKQDIYQLTAEEYCALHLASLCEAAHEAATDPTLPSPSRVVAYSRDLSQDLIQDVLPRFFQVPSDEVDAPRMMEVAGRYSKLKNGVTSNGKGPRGEWKDDSSTKERQSRPAVQQAVERFLQPSFDKLQALAESYKEN